MMSAGSTAAALYLLALAVLNINCFVVNEITPWLPTSIPFHHLPQSKLLFTTLCHSKFHASMKCKFKANCNVFCSDTNGEFSFYRIRAEAFLPQIGDFKNCWTRNPRKNIILEQELFFLLHRIIEPTGRWIILKMAFIIILSMTQCI